MDPMDPHPPTWNVPFVFSRPLRPLIVSIGPCFLCAVLSVIACCVCRRRAFAWPLDAPF